MNDTASSDRSDHDDHDDHDGGAPRGTVRVRVFAPRHTEPKTFAWSVHLTVGAAAKEAAAAFGYAAGNPTLAKEDRALNRDLELGATDIENGDKLDLTDIGGGV